MGSKKTERKKKRKRKRERERERERERMKGTEYKMKKERGKLR